MSRFVFEFFTANDAVKLLAPTSTRKEIIMTEENPISVYLNVCEEHSPIEMGGQAYASGFRGKLESVPFQMLESDSIMLDLSDFGIKPTIGDAGKIQNISVRVCKGSISVIAIYTEPMMNAEGCCVCKDCPSGYRSCVYGSSGCDPGC
jgi:hypothetical protein